MNGVGIRLFDPPFPLAENMEKIFPTCLTECVLELETILNIEPAPESFVNHFLKSPQGLDKDSPGERFNSP